MTEVSFFVPGVPVGQGNHRTSASGHVYETTRGHKEWRDKIVQVALTEDPGPIGGPVKVYADFYFPRPKSHYRTGKNSQLLKDGAPGWHTTTPDADKLARALGDSLAAAGVIKDDKQIAQWSITKSYGEPGVAVIIITLEEA